MKEIVVLSGKGGTGKTSLTAAFAGLVSGPVLVDCDVDASNLPLVLDPQVRDRGQFVGGLQATIDAARCTGCARCLEVCRFGAVRPGVDGTYEVDPVACEGCGVCGWSCPAYAIDLEDAVNWEWFVSDTRLGLLVHARLGAAQENSGKLVALLRKKARELAQLYGLQLSLVDGAPGIGCPVIASISGADLAVLVTEPTIAGAHDLGRVADLATHFHVPAVVCVNRWDISPQMTQAIEEEADRRGMPVVGRVEYDPVFTAAQVNQLTVMECSDGLVQDQVRSLWNSIARCLEGSSTASPTGKGGAA